VTRKLLTKQQGGLHCEPCAIFKNQVVRGGRGVWNMRIKL